MDLLFEKLLILVAMLICFFVGIAIGTTYDIKIDSPQIIIPDEKLVIVNNKVDTIYQYKLK